jgi:hypothetical protein
MMALVMPAHKDRPAVLAVLMPSAAVVADITMTVSPFLAMGDLDQRAVVGAPGRATQRK